MAGINGGSELETELERLYQQWGALGYWARRFHQLFSPGRKNYRGGVAAVRSVLSKSGTAGFAFLNEHGRLDLTVESLVLRPQWQQLFSDADRRTARLKLSRCA